MDETRGLPVHPAGVVWAVVTAFVVVSVAVRPEWVQPHYEGPLEHVSHLVLVGSVVLWGMCARAADGRQRAVALGMTAWLLLLWLEEIDWGAVYGLTDGLRGIVGAPSLHHSSSANTSPFADKLKWFAVPIVLWFALPRVPRVGDWLSRLDPIPATVSESRWFFAALLTHMAVDVLTPVFAADAYQLVVYILFGMSAVRIRREL